MKKIMILAFYAVSNSMDYERHSFDYDNSDLETYKKLLSLNEDDVRMYSEDTSVQQHLDLNEFVYDYNDEYLDGGWWCIKLHLTKEEIDSCY